MSYLEQVLVTREEGIRDCTWAEYHALRHMNASTIKVGALDSMRAMRWEWEHPREDTDAMQWGRMAHTLLLERERFGHRYRPWDGRRAGNDYKAFCVDARSQGAEVVRATGEWSYETVMQAAHEWIKDPMVCNLLRGARTEISLVTVEANVQCKARVDSAKLGTLIDIKTSRSIAARQFSRQFYDLGYDIQLGLYERWLRRVLVESGRMTVKVVCLQNKPPYDVAIVPVHESVLDRGTQKGLLVLDRLAECIEHGYWPGVAEGEEYYLHTPNWEMDDDELTGVEEVSYA